MRGEYLTGKYNHPRNIGSPPHARGIQTEITYLSALSGITPACAGNTAGSVECSHIPWDHPRMRGEYLHIQPGRRKTRGSPPHARGIQIALTVSAWSSGITPACAGNTETRRSDLSVKRDHPRMRGEYFDENKKVIVEQGSPPHARGILYEYVLSLYPIGITPACAGNTWQRSPSAVADRDHPRMRGEYSCTVISQARDTGSPPHARGIRTDCGNDGYQIGITPACAGNTLCRSSPIVAFRDHPRMRGEYAEEFEQLLWNEGSPPHARGIL